MPLPTKSQTSYAQSLLTSSFEPSPTSEHSRIKSRLNLQPHPEGGYFAETDRDLHKVPNPFQGTPIYPNATVKSDDHAGSGIDGTTTRDASTTIYYYLDPASPHGVLHRNKGRTVHTLHWGRGLYVLIHADEIGSSSSSSSSNQVEKLPRIETFTVGPNIAAGEKLQWIVEGGKFKASILMPDDDAVEGSEKGLLISETVVPGFEYMDHDFLTAEGLVGLVGGKEEEDELRWLLREEMNKRERMR